MNVVERSLVALCALVMAAIPAVADAPHDFDGDGKTDRTVVRKGYYSPCQLPLPAWAACKSSENSYLFTWLTRNSSDSQQQISSLVKARHTFSFFDAALSTKDSDGFSERTLLSAADDTVFNRSQGGNTFFHHAEFQVDQIVGDGQGNLSASGYPWFLLADPRSLESVVEELFGAAASLTIQTQMAGVLVDYVFRPVYQVTLEDGQSHTLFSPTASADSAAELLFPLGVPVVGDYDGDGTDDLAVFGYRDQVWTIHLSSNDSRLEIQWGLAQDKAIPGDYDGDGRSDLAVWRPSTAVWYILHSSTGYDKTQARVQQFGLPEVCIPVPNSSSCITRRDFPVEGDFDGDGKRDIAVYRQRDGVWYVLRSSDGVVSATQWGLPQDVPVGMSPSDRALGYYFN